MAHMGEHVADNVNAIGLIVDDDRREIDSAASKTLWIGSGAFEQIRYNSNYNIYWGQSGMLRSWKVDESVYLEFRNRLSTSVSLSEEFKLFEKDFRNRLVGVESAPVPASAQDPCRFLCEPTLLVEPTITFEKDATVFETIFALDLSTPIPRVGVTLEAITKPFQDENDVELESELKLYWLESEQTGGWLSSHFDIVDKFSPAEQADRYARVHTQAEFRARYGGCGVQPAAGYATGCTTLRSRARSTTSPPGLPKDAEPVVVLARRRSSSLALVHEAD